MIVCLLLIGTLQFCLAQSSVTTESGLISSDTTWTQAGSPYNLVGDISVSSGVTLTIEAGATVNLNSYHMTVNGVLVASGTSTNKIQINGISSSGPFMPPPALNPSPFTYGINFTALSVGYNAQSGSGSIIENAIFNSTTLALEGSPKINNDVINGYITSNGTSVISNNIVAGEIDLTGPSTVSNNQINGAIQVQTNVVGGNLEDSSNPEGAPVISNNKVTGGGNNGIGISFLTDTITGLNTYSGNTITIFGNTITGCNKAGIGAEGVGLIENNLIMNNQNGIEIQGPNTVDNNTIENNEVGILQAFNFIAPTVSYNNIEKNSYNYYLNGGSVPINITATYNYWGTIDQTAISNSIYDNKDDSSLGVVNFAPFLTAPNSDAVPNPTPTPATTPTPTTTTTPTSTATSTPAVPEFPTLTVVLILLLAVSVTLITVKVRKRRISINKQSQR